MVQQKYYVVYNTVTGEKVVVDSIKTANQLRKGKNMNCKKFLTKKEAEEWNFSAKVSKKSKSTPKIKYYVVFSKKKKEKFIVNSWEKAEKIIDRGGYTCKSFPTMEEAVSFVPFDTVQKNRLPSLNIKELKVIDEKGIFFDMGTGRGIGEEVRVSDFEGNSLLNKLEEYTGLINQYGNYNLGKINNTNYGELYGLYLALLIALRNNIYKIAGDSKTVINQWSKGEIILSKILPYEQELIYKVIDLRKEFETKGGEVCYINASLNPADLGFHKNKRKVKVIEEVDNS